MLVLSCGWMFFKKNKKNDLSKFCSCYADEMTIEGLVDDAALADHEDFKGDGHKDNTAAASFEVV